MSVIIVAKLSFVINNFVPRIIHIENRIYSMAIKFVNKNLGKAMTVVN